MEQLKNLKKIEKFVFGISLLFIFLVFLNFRDIPNRYTLLAATGLYGFYVLAYQRLYINASTVLLGITLFFYARLREFDTANTIMHGALPVVFILLGKALMQRENTTEKNQTFWLLLPVFSFIVGYSGHGILNGMVYFIEGPIQEGVRYWADVWTGNIMPGTQHSIYLLPVLSVMFPAIVYFRKHKLLCSVTLMTGLFSLYYAFASLSRMSVLIFGMLFVWQFFLFLCLNKDNKRFMDFTKKAVLVLAGVGIITILVIIFNRETILKIPFVANLGKDGGILNNLRFRAQRSVLTQLFAYPKGGMPMPADGIQMAHNVWLDMAKDTGIITFSCFLIYTFCTFGQMVKLLSGKSSAQIKYVFSGIYFAFILYYNVEPALNANIQYMLPWMFLNGMLYGVNQKMEESKNQDCVLTRKQRMYLPVKRTMDVILSSIAIVVLSPVLLGISVAIKLDSPGPVLFKQKRVGKNKEFFDIWKFRTMRTDTPKDMPTHMLKDPKQYITKTGRFLRKTSLDELPQLFQIFSGKMSICGPRPALWNQDDLIAERDKYGANGVTPGLTGWAQINGRDELEIDVKARLDGEYIEKFGFLMDLRCFFGTIVSVAKSDGVVEGGTGELNRKK